MKIAIFVAAVGMSTLLAIQFIPESSSPNAQSLNKKLNELSKKLSRFQATLKTQQNKIHKLEQGVKTARLEIGNPSAVPGPDKKKTKNQGTSLDSQLATQMASPKDIKEQVAAAFAQLQKEQKKKRAEKYKKDSKEMEKGFAKKIVKSLDLDEYTAQELTRIISDNWTKIEEVWEDKKQSWKEKEDATKKIDGQTDEKLKQVLTEDQFKKYKKTVKEIWGQYGTYN